MTVLNGDCRDLFKQVDEASVDAIVTDPPYELGFMGKAWDASGIAYDESVWREALRVLKPGGHLLAFGGSRTYHRMACAIEDAGFEVRDQMMWLYGSGFPKSMDVAKAIDKKLGTEHLREFKSKNPADRPYTHQEGETSTGWQSPPRPDKTHPGSDEARQWDGWGTALKPAHEPIVVARKPFKGTVAANVTEHGTGAINIDACRVGQGGQLKWSEPRNMGYQGGADSEQATAISSPAGRWPANVILDEEAGALLDEQSGMTRDGSSGNKSRGFGNQFVNGTHGNLEESGWGYGGQGGASRFFYCAKASRRERNAGLDELPSVTHRRYGARGQGPLPQQTPPKEQNAANHHPTVKPIALMRYLVRLVTPKGGLVLDPFTGSGTTGIAAVLEGMDFLGFEQDQDYAAIADARIGFWQKDQQMNLDLGLAA